MKLLDKVKIVLCLSLVVAVCPILLSQESESDYYKIVTLPIPDGVVLEGGGLAVLPNGNLMVATRRGDIYRIDNPTMENGNAPHYSKYATGMHELLGLEYKDGSMYAAQRGELTKLDDRNGDGKADSYETIASWPLTGNYHEYSFGPKIADDGSMYVTGNVGFFSPDWWSGKSRVPWRGWTLRIEKDGSITPFAAGMRSPCGIGIIDGELFYADNQGDWIGSGGLVHLEKGDFAGHPASLNWADHPDSPVKISTNDVYYRVSPRIAAPGKSPNKPENIEKEEVFPLFKLGEDFPAVKTPAVWLPHGVLGTSTSEIIIDETNGQFGPFPGQVFIGDQGQSKIVRVDLEKVNGVYQGAAFAFIEGFQSGVLRMEWAHDGSLFVGQTNRGWGSTGKSPFGLQRVVFTGRTPFEMKNVKAKPDGFEIHFTQPVNKETAGNPDSYSINSFVYKYHPVYGSPAANLKKCPIAGVIVSRDGMSVRIVVDSLVRKYIHEITALDVTSYLDNKTLLHPTAYYTLNEIPDGDKIDRSTLPKRKAKVVHEHPVEAKTKSKPVVAKSKVSTPKAKNTARSSASRSKRVITQPRSWSKIDKQIIISTLPGLKYDQTRLTAKAGSKVKLSFYNNDDMPHNLVIVNPNQADNIGKMAISMGVQGAAKQYIPSSSQVLHHTRLLPPGTSDSIYFVAPSTPGTYMYVCTYPGHYAVMRGVLIVTP